VTYPKEGGMIVDPFHSVPIIVQEAEIPIIRDVVRSICQYCEMDFRLISNDILDLVVDKSYKYTLYPCPRHTFHLVDIQGLIDRALKQNLDLTKTLKAPYDPRLPWNYTSPAHGWGGNERPNEGQNKARDLRVAYALGLKGLIELWKGDADGCIWLTNLPE